MKILWVTWKDWQHPDAGGAELVLEQIVKRQAADGHDVSILTALYPGAQEHEFMSLPELASDSALSSVSERRRASRGGVQEYIDTSSGDGKQKMGKKQAESTASPESRPAGAVCEVVRIKGNRYIQPFKTLPYFIKHCRGKYDMVIEVVNTAPYFTPFFKGKNTKSVLFYHQLARNIWFYEAPFPVSLIGYAILEPLATFMLGRSGAKTVTVSNSTKKDLMRYGFRARSISIISEGITIKPIQKLDNSNSKFKGKYSQPTVLSLGAMRAMKQTLDQVKAFELARDEMPELRLKIAGSATGSYGNQVLSYIESSSHREAIEYLGRVSEAEKLCLMQKSHVLLQTATKEGWGLTVTEANSQGTPAVVYNSDGLRDSVQHGKTGLICKVNDQYELAKNIVKLFKKPDQYAKMQQNAWQWSKQITFDQCYKDFKKAVGQRS